MRIGGGLLLATLGSIVGLWAGGVFDSPDQRAERRFAIGICSFLRSQPELSLHPKGSALVFRSSGRHCIDTSPQPPWYGASAQYRWTAGALNWQKMETFFRPRLVGRGWTGVRVASGDATLGGSISAQSVRNGVRIRIAVTWDPGRAEKVVYRKGRYDFVPRSPADRRTFWVEVTTSRSLQDAQQTKSGPPRATLAR